MFSILIYGFPRTGKTVFCGSTLEIKELQPSLLIDLEGGALSIKSKLHKLDLGEALNGNFKDIKTDKINYLRINTWKDIENVIKKLTIDNPFKLLMIDSISELSYMNMENIVAIEAANNPRRNNYTIEIQDYSKSLIQIKRLVRIVKDLGIPVIFTGMGNTEKDELVGNIIIRPHMQGNKIINDLMGQIDLIIYLSADKGGENYNVGHLVPTRQAVAGCRIENLEKQQIPNIKMKDVYDLVTI